MSEKTQLEKEYGEDEIHTYAINDPVRFKEEWDKINDKDIDEVVLFYHGNPHALIMGDSGLVTNSEGTTSRDGAAVKISDLSEKTIKELTINSCNTGHLDHENNVASTFLTTQNIGSVMSWDGSMVYNKKYGFRDKGFGPYIGVLAYNQHHFESWLMGDKRGPFGQVEYWIDENGVIQTKTWVYSSLEGKIEMVKAYNDWYIGGACCSK